MDSALMKLAFVGLSVIPTILSHHSAVCNPPVSCSVFIPPKKRMSFIYAVEEARYGPLKIWVIG